MAPSWKRKPAPAPTPTGNNALSLDPAKWSLLGGRHRADLSVIDNPIYPNFLSGALSLDFPADTNPGDGFITVNYLTTLYTLPMLGKAAISVDIDMVMSGATHFEWKTAANNLDSTTPAKFRFMFWSDERYTGMESGRWFSNPTAFQLDQGGAARMTVPLTPDRWSNVYGKFGSQVPAQFQQALGHPTKLGFVMGGGWFFGHGVYITGGAARLNIHNLVIG